MSSTPIQIRPASAGDAPAIATLLRESFIEYESLYTAAGFAATAITPEQVIDRLSEGPVWLAMHGETIVGTASVVAKGDSLYIRGMAVHPAARGRHIGKLLLSHIEELARSEGFTRLFLSTTPFLNRAISLYQRFGFRRKNEGPEDLFGTPLFTMEKRLAAVSGQKEAEASE